MRTAPTLTVTDVEGGKKVDAVNNESALGAELKYTDDGNDPTSESADWPEGGVTITDEGETVIKAASFIGTASSDVASVTVVIEEE